MSPLICWSVYLCVETLQEVEGNKHLHIAQQMLLPLTISCSSKSRLVLTCLVLPFWYLLTRVVADIFQKSSKTVVCVCVCVCVSVSLSIWSIVENGLLNLDAIWGGGSTGSKDEASRWGGDRPSGRGNFWVGHRASHCNQWRLCCLVV